MTRDHNIHSRIRACRESRGYSQDYMADMLGICQSAYANLEGGKTSISIDRLIKIAGLLDVNIHGLINEGIRDDVNSDKGDLISGETKALYETLVTELKNEVEFLRSIIRDKQMA